MWRTCVTAVALSSILLLQSAVAHSQSPTIPERAAAKHGAPLEIVIGRDTPQMSVKDLAKADLIVRGRLTNPRSYLSADKYHIHTDYDLVPDQVFLSRGVGATRKDPGISPLRVTMYGGTLVINGATVTFRDLSQKRWTPGSDTLLFLMRDEPSTANTIESIAQNWRPGLQPCGGAAGMFEILGGARLKALAGSEGEGEGIEAMTLDQVVREILTEANR